MFGSRVKWKATCSNGGGMVEGDGESGVAAGILGSGIPSRVYISRVQSKTFAKSALCLN